MSLCTLQKHDPDDIEYFSVALQQSDLEQRHVGVIINPDGEDSPILCHLAWHYILRAEAVSDKFVWVESALPVPLKKNLVAYIQLVLSTNTDHGLPYSFSEYTGSFDPANGKYIKTKPGSGLTCATFILGVFDAIGVTLVDLENWPSRPSDEVWQHKMMQQFIRLLYHPNSNYRPSLEHVIALREFVGVKRVLPEETAASTITNKPPAPVTEIISLGANIVLDMNSLVT